MSDFLSNYYVWIKAVHIIFAIAWMAGLLMAPRLRIYQLSSAPGEKLFDTMLNASARLRKIILAPAMGMTWIIALTMVWLNPGLLEAGWFHVKIALVIALTGIHIWIGRIGRVIDTGAPSLPEKHLRLLNELPFLVMIGIVTLAVAKPF